MREPIKEIFLAAALLDRATEAHLAGDRVSAAALIRNADMPEIRSWTESLWGSRKANPDQCRFHRFRAISDAPPLLSKPDRVQLRMPSAEDRTKLIVKYGRNCTFCGIPLIRSEIRSAFSVAYPEAAYWGGTNFTQHAAFQCLWLQFDHVVPHSRGGDNSIDNVLITCSGCNYGRMHWILDEVGLIDPRGIPTKRTTWDGLERFLSRRDG